jgi:hypothetical protein
MKIDINVTDYEIIDIIDVDPQCKTIDHNITINVTGIKNPDMSEYPVTFTFSPIYDDVK